MEQYITNFVGSTRKSDLSRLGNARTVNMFVEKKGDQYTYSTILRGMNGWKKLFDGEGRARCIVKSSNGHFFYAMGNNIYCDGVKIHSIADTAYCSMTLTGGNDPYLVVVDGFNMYAVKTTQHISDMGRNVKRIELPDGVKPISVAVVYDFIMVLAKDSDKIYSSVQYPWEADYSSYGSDEDDIFMLHFKNSDGTEIYPEGYFLSSDYKSDSAHSMISTKGMLYVAGDDSIQAFSYLGSTPLALTGSVWSSQEGNCHITSVYRDSLIAIDEIYAYVGRNGVYVNNVKVSDDEVDRRISSEGFFHSSYIRWYSHLLYIVHTGKSTMAYDVGEDCWIDLCSTSDGNFTRYRYDRCIGRYALAEDGVCEMVDGKWTEHDGKRIVKMRRSPIMTRNGKTLKIDKLQIDGNIGDFDGQGSMQWIVDGEVVRDYTFPISTRGIYNIGKNFTFYRLGYGRQFELQVSCDCDNELSFYGINMDVKEAMR